MSSTGEQPAVPSEERDHQVDPPRIYAASLSDYNAGILHGSWLPVIDLDQLQRDITKMLAASPTTARYGEPAEEWAIHDYDGFATVALGEYESLTTVVALAQGLREHGSAFAGWVDYVGLNSPEEWAGFDDAYQGCFDSLADYGDHIVRDIYGIDPDQLPGVPESLAAYVHIDTEALTRDLVASGECFTSHSDDGLHVFWTM